MANNSPAKSRSRLITLVECALMVALAVVLGLIPLPKWPNGGSLSIAAVPIIFISYRRGTRWGLAAALVYAVIQLLTGWYAPPAGTLLAVAACVLLDYLLAFTAFGLANVFAKPSGKKQLIGYGVGAVIVNVIRFVCSFLSGWLLWGSYAPEGQPVWLYSLTYNGGYMLPNAILCGIITVLLCALVSPKTLKPMA